MGKRCLNCGKDFVDLGDFCRPSCEAAYGASPKPGTVESLTKAEFVASVRRQVETIEAQGRKCPHCGKDIPVMSGAERQRRYRERKRSG